MFGYCRSEPGFTLVEVVVALTVLSFGLLAVASGLSAVIRMATEGRSLEEVAVLAAGRLELVRAEGCGSVGREVRGPYTVSWSGSPVSGGRLVLIAVERRTRRGLRTDSLTAFQRCVD